MIYLKSILILPVFAIIEANVVPRNPKPNFDEIKSYADVVKQLKKWNWSKNLIEYIPSLSPLKPKRIDHFDVSSKFGYRKHPIHGKYKFHNGIDIPSKQGTPVHATASGLVIMVAYDRKGLGIYIEIDHLNGFHTLYGHLKGFIVRKGQRVKQGQLIGHVGHTGLSTGNHLHYIIKKNSRTLNPYKFCFLMVERLKYLKRIEQKHKV